PQRASLAALSAPRPRARPLARSPRLARPAAERALRGALPAGASLGRSAARAPLSQGAQARTATCGELARRAPSAAHPAEEAALRSRVLPRPVPAQEDGPLRPPPGGAPGCARTPERLRAGRAARRRAPGARGRRVRRGHCARGRARLGLV